ncbi:MAG: hypothetical protein U0610_11610, partial [bacterium]
MTDSDRADAPRRPHSRATIRELLALRSLPELDRLEALAASAPELIRLERLASIPCGERSFPLYACHLG